MRGLSIQLSAAALTAFWLGVPADAQENKRPLPKEAPATPRLEFTGPSEGYPPELKGATGVRVLEWREFPGALTDEVAAQARHTALADPRVMKAVGERYAYVSVDEIEPRVKHARKPEERWPLRLVFFSHSANVPIEVLLTAGGRQVSAVKRMVGSWPHEGRDEVKQAVALARADARLAGTADLLGEGLVIEPAKGSPGYGHRVLHLTFRKADEDAPRQIAIVDLTDQKLIDVRAGKAR